MLLTACSLAGDITPPPGTGVVVRPSQAAPRPVTAPRARPSVAAGAELYAQNCTRCHGSLGAGDGDMAGQIDTPLPDFTDSRLAAGRTPVDWFEIITNGRIETLMPPWDDALSDAQRWDLAAYLYTLSAPEGVLQAGADIFRLQCAECHGAAGNGDGVEAADLAQPVPDFTDGSYMITRSNAEFADVVQAGRGEAMPAFADALTAAELQAVVAYTRSLWYGATEPPVVAAVEEAAAEGDQATEPESFGVGEGRVVGALLNRSSDAAAPGGIEVTLHIFDGFQIADTRTTFTDADGAFAFEDVRVSPGRTLVTTTEFDAVLYTSDIFSVDEGVSEYRADIPVFEATTDTSVLNIEQLHVIVQDAASSLQVTEVVSFSNHSMQTLVAPAEGGATFEFALPAEVSDLQFDDSFASAVQPTASGFAIVRPVFPDAEPYQLVFSFLLPYDGELAFEQLATHPVGATNIVLPQGSLRLVGDGFSSLGPRELGDGLSIVAHTGPSLAAGESLRFELRGYTEAAGLSAMFERGHTGELAVGAGALIAVIAGLGWWWYRRRTDRVTDGVHTGLDGEYSPAQAAARRDALLRAIAKLDDTFEHDSSSASAYRRRRAALKQELVELVQEFGLDI